MFTDYQKHDEQIIGPLETTVTCENWQSFAKKCDILLKQKQFENAASSVSQLLEFLSSNTSLVNDMDLCKFYILYGKALIGLCESNIHENATIMRASAYGAIEEKDSAEATEGGPTKQENETSNACPLEANGDTSNASPQSQQQQPQQQPQQQQQQQPVDGSEKDGTPKVEKEKTEKRTTPVQVTNEEEETEEEKIFAQSAKEGDVEGWDKVINDDVFSQLMMYSRTESASDDLELAWEALETARVLCEKHLAKPQLSQETIAEAASMLIEIYSQLGEMELINGNFKASLDEIGKGIAVYHKYQLQDIRQLAYCHFMCVTAAGHGYFAEAYESNMKTTISLVEERLIQLVNQFGIGPKYDKVEEAWGDINKILDDEKLKEKSPVQVDEMREMKAILDELLTKDPTLPEEEDEEEGGEEEGTDTLKKNGSDTLKSCSGESKCDENEKENNQQGNTCPAPGTEDKPSEAKRDEERTRSTRKRTFHESGIADETISEPSTKKLRTNE